MRLNISSNHSEHISCELRSVHHTAASESQIRDLNKVQKVLDALSSKEGGAAKKFFKKALVVYSVREEIKDCSRQLDESFQLFMVSTQCNRGYFAQSLSELRHKFHCASSRVVT
jgi:hypothetical protein